MQFADSDFQQVNQVAQLINFCDAADNKTLEQIVDEIYRHQPFLRSLFIGDKDVLDMAGFGEVLRLLILVYLFFLW